MKHWLQRRRLEKSRNWDDPTAGKHSKDGKYTVGLDQALGYVLGKMKPEKADKIRNAIAGK